eukprot:scaffold70567_cov52-Cyclotella_meneghiniana.AAC.1
MSESFAACGIAIAGLLYGLMSIVRMYTKLSKGSCEETSAKLLDQKLFAQPPDREDCVICAVRMPLTLNDIRYQSCCGKNICIGCSFYITLNCRQCPFCKSSFVRSSSDEENKERLLARISKYNDPEAITMLGCYYREGLYGFPVNQSKGVELFQRASELGSADGHYNLADSYFFGKGIEVDKKKAIHHYQMAAMMGDNDARYMLACIEFNDGNIERAIKHCIISAKCGHDESLTRVKKGFIAGDVTKDDFEMALRCHKASLDETKSKQRDRAKAALRGDVTKEDFEKAMRCHKASVDGTRSKEREIELKQPCEVKVAGV